MGCHLLLQKVKEESENAGLKLSIQKTKIMAFRPITSWQIDGETVKTVRLLFSWAPKSLQMVTAAFSGVVRGMLLLLSHFSHVRLCVTP